MFKLGLAELEQMKTFVLVLLACLSQFRGGSNAGFCLVGSILDVVCVIKCGSKG